MKFGRLKKEIDEFLPYNIGQNDVFLASTERIKSEEILMC